MSEKLTTKQIHTAAAEAGVTLTEADILHIEAQLDSFDVLLGVDVSNVLPMFGYGAESFRIARRK